MHAKTSNISLRSLPGTASAIRPSTLPPSPPARSLLCTPDPGYHVHIPFPSRSCLYDCQVILPLEFQHSSQKGIVSILRASPSGNGCPVSLSNDLPFGGVFLPQYRMSSFPHREHSRPHSIQCQVSEWLPGPPGTGDLTSGRTQFCGPRDNQKHGYGTDSGPGPGRETHSWRKYGLRFHF